MFIIRVFIYEKRKDGAVRDEKTFKAITNKVALIDGIVKSRVER